MNKVDFPNPKLKLPKEIRDSKENHTAKSFEAVDIYFNLVQEYIYTDINLDYRQTDPLHSHAWIQRITSAGLLRSLYIRNGLVDSINTRNPMGMFLNLKALVENGGSVSNAMRIAGYSEATMKTPTKLTMSKNWEELLEKFLPNDYVMEQHKRLFNQKQIQYFSFPKTMSDQEILSHVGSSGLQVISIRASEKAKIAFYAMPDTQAIKSALDMAHKLKGNYAPTKVDQTIQEKPAVIVGMKVIYEKQ